MIHISPIFLGLFFVVIYSYASGEVSDGSHYVYAKDWDNKIDIQGMLDEFQTTSRNKSMLFCAARCKEHACGYFFHSDTFCRIHEGTLRSITMYSDSLLEQRIGSKCYISTSPSVCRQGHQDNVERKYFLFLNETKKTFYDTQTFCESKGLQMAAPRDMTSMGRLLAVIDRHIGTYRNNHSAFYLGFKYVEECHNFVSLNDNCILPVPGANSKNSIWLPTEPQKLLNPTSENKDSDCVILRGDYNYTVADDFNCITAVYVVCER